MNNNDTSSRDMLTRLFPAPPASIPLNGLYLGHDLRRLGTRARPFVYASFITSLDGRISLPHPTKPTHLVPGAVANPRDWRLFQELAAQADVLVTSGRYMRQLDRDMAQDSLPVSGEPAYTDLIEWRKSQSLPPQPAVVILSGSLNVPIPENLLNSGRPVYVATGAQADPQRMKAIEATGARVLIAGRNSRVEGRQLVTALGQQGFATIDMIAGSEVLNSLLADKALDRLYLTHALRVLGGVSFDTLVKGKQLEPPTDFNLHSLHYDAGAGQKTNQLFAVYESVPGAEGSTSPAA